MAPEASCLCLCLCLILFSISILFSVSFVRRFRSAACIRASVTRRWAYSLASVLTTTAMSPACPGATSSDSRGLRLAPPTGRRCRKRVVWRARAVLGGRSPPGGQGGDFAFAFAFELVLALILALILALMLALILALILAPISPLPEIGRCCSWTRQWATYLAIASPGKAALRKASKRDCSILEKVLRTWAICLPSAVAVLLVGGSEQSREEQRREGGVMVRFFCFVLFRFHKVKSNLNPI
mmetsp:Transcript_7355/g.18459  ORF Transcript_7355/g.18459 Transcript_7355/m.18459 type:complete len:241 (-) Transcript_7355:144-866(-)